MKKQPFIQYDPNFRHEWGTEAIRLYLPTDVGFVNYNIAHSVREEVFCDTWRLSTAFAFDDELKNEYPLGPRAEWDMALHLKDRDDFIGGLLHGDEFFTQVSLYLNGRETEISSVTSLTPLEELSLCVDSLGYDPADHKSLVLRHSKAYSLTHGGIALDQTVEWQGDYELTSCYMAMMPPYKKYTDHFSTDTDPESREIGGENHNIPGAGSATLTGESGHLFRMSVPIYPCYESGGRLLIQDNGGNPYNKMYFPVCLESASVMAGEVWKTRTEYEIKICKLLPKQ